MATPYKVDVVTPDGTAFSGEAEIMVVPGAAGELGILAHHAPLISSLKPGRTHLTVAEAFTGTPGIYVQLDETIRSFQEILDGKHDDVPEQAFYLVGGIDDVVARAEEMKSSAAA